jgi:hypothetical protein
MASTSDVVVENFKVGGLAKFGLDAAALRAANPRLVYASITGFGQDGPYKERAGYDYIIQGMSGLMSITGQPDGAPGGEPMRVGVAVVDLFIAMLVPGRAPVAGVVAGARPLDLDDLGAEIGEQLRAPGPRQYPAKVEHLDSDERFHHPPTLNPLMLSSRCKRRIEALLVLRYAPAALLRMIGCELRVMPTSATTGDQPTLPAPHYDPARR